MLKSKWWKMEHREIPDWVIILMLISILLGFVLLFIFPSVNQDTRPVALKGLKGIGLETFGDWMGAIYPILVLTMILSAMYFLFIKKDKK